MTFLIIINVINLIMLSPFIYYQVKTTYYNYLKNVTLRIVWSFGFLISLIGEIGGGKSSGQSALTHAYTIEAQNKILELMLQTKKIFKSLDFNSIDSDLIEIFSTFEPDFALTTEHIMDKYHINDTIIFNFMSHKTTKDYIKDYIFSFYVLNFRNNYVYSVTKIYNRITGNYNMIYDIEWQHIKSAYIKGDYAIEDYAVELIDEASDKQASAFWREVEKDESGAKEYRRKYRHIHQERNRMIDTRQDATDFIKKFRNLTQTHLLMEGTEFLNVYQGLTKVFGLIYIFPYKIHEIFKLRIPYLFYRLKNLKNGVSYYEYQDMKYGSINYRRKVDNKLLHVEWFVKSMGIAKFNTRRYHDAEDVGKKSPDLYDPLKLYFDALWAFGTYEQFAFKGIQEELLKVSNNQSTEVNVFFQPSFFNELDSTSERGVGEIDFD